MLYLVSDWFFINLKLFLKKVFYLVYLLYVVENHFATSLPQGKGSTIRWVSVMKFLTSLYF